MKISTEHYEYMKAAIAELDGRFPIAAYRANHPEYSAKRVAWDYCHAANLTGFLCSDLYSYLNDTHIDTALRNIVAELTEVAQ